MLPRQHQRQLGAIEPARLLDLALVDDDLCRSPLRRDSRSSATTETARAATQNISPARRRCPTSSATSRRTASSIDSPGSQKPARHDHMVCGKRGERPSTQRSPAIGSMMTTGSVRGKCSALQTGQSRRQPACTSSVVGAAIATEAMARVPAEHRLGLGERRHMRGVDLALHRDGAQIDQLEIVARLQWLDRGRVDADAEARCVVEEPEKHDLARGAERACFVRRKQRIERRAVRLEHDELAADHVDAGALDARTAPRAWPDRRARRRRARRGCRNRPGAAVSFPP